MNNWKVTRFGEVKLNKEFTPEVSAETIVIQSREEIFCVLAKENESAANLIAAAPELLKAAELLREALEEHGRMLNTKQVKATKLLEAALAKARGDS